jgi:hypothetical protein
MVEYRAYTIGPDGHILKSTPMVCDDDKQAIEQAREISKVLRLRSGAAIAWLPG